MIRKHSLLLVIATVLIVFPFSLSAQFPYEHCWNGMDDNEDGLLDCDDPACVDVFVCHRKVENCSNGEDDDYDRQIDCEDSDCENVTLCTPNVEVCDDGLDNDADGLVDCNDANCRDTGVCSLCFAGAAPSDLTQLSSPPGAFEVIHTKNIAIDVPFEFTRISPILERAEVTCEMTQERGNQIFRLGIGSASIDGANMRAGNDPIDGEFNVKVVVPVPMKTLYPRSIDAMSYECKIQVCGGGLGCVDGAQASKLGINVPISVFTVAGKVSS